MNLRELINQHFDTDYPISGGTGNSLDNPIVIEREENDIDYQVVQKGVLYCIGQARDMSWELMENMRVNHNGRELDQLVVEVREKQGGYVKTSTVNYYFDITNYV